MKVFEPRVFVAFVLMKEILVCVDEVEDILSGDRS